MLDLIIHTFSYLKNFFQSKSKVSSRFPSTRRSLDDKLKGVNLPVYAKGKHLPPKAKIKYIEMAKRGEL